MLPPRLDATGVKPASVVSPAPAAVPVSDARQAAFQRAMGSLVGQSMKGEVLSKYDDGSFLVRVAGSSARMQLPTGAQVGAEVPLTLVSVTPRPTFQVGNGAQTAQMSPAPGQPQGEAAPPAQPGNLPSQDSAATVPGRQPGAAQPGPQGAPNGQAAGAGGQPGAAPGTLPGTPGAPVPGAAATPAGAGQPGAPGTAAGTGLPAGLAAAPGTGSTAAGANTATLAAGNAAVAADASLAEGASPAPAPATANANANAPAQARPGLAQQAAPSGAQPGAAAQAAAGLAAGAGADPAAAGGAPVAQARPQSLAATLLGKAPLTPAEQLPELSRDTPAAVLSPAARAIAGALSAAYTSPGVPATINGKTPLVSSGVPDADQLAHSLKNALGESGLFYESHVAEWAEGKRPLQELMREPQNQRAAQAQAQQGGPQTSETLARAALASPDLSAAQMINQQLHAHEQQRVQWNGQAWPGQPVQWDVQRDQREGGQHAQQDGRDGEAVWRSGVRFRLPLLGKISASVTMVGEQVHIQVQTGDGDSAATLRAWSGKLQLAMEAAGSPLTSLTIAPEGAADGAAGQAVAAVAAVAGGADGV